MILAIDQGTTGSTAIIFAADGSVLNRAYSEFTQIYPNPGWVEHDPMEIWQVTLDTCKQAIKDADIDANQLKSIGITNQRETCLLWHKETGKPVHNAIVWQCRRSADICNKLKQNESIDITAKTGLRFDPYFSASKVLWLFEQYPDIKQQADNGELLFGTIDTWLIWQLTGGQSHVTDHTNASRTLMYNINTQSWDDELLAIYAINKAILPQINPSSSHFGQTVSGLISDQPINIHGVAGDQQAALFGQGCTTAGMVKNTYGTGCFMLMNTGNKAVPSANGLLTTMACGASGQPAYALEGSVFMAGAAVQWLRDEMELIKKASETAAIAESIDSTDGVYLVPAFTGLGAPYWDSQARGTIVGLTRGSGKKHIVRATLEAIAYQATDVLRLMVKESGVKISQLKVDGGACANNFLMQFQADMLDVELIRPTNVDSTAIGAAMLAAIGCSIWPAGKMPEKLAQMSASFTASIDDKQREALYSGWLKAVEKAKGDG